MLLSWRWIIVAAPLGLLARTNAAALPPLFFRPANRAAADFGVPGLAAAGAGGGVGVGVGVGVEDAVAVVGSSVAASP